MLSLKASLITGCFALCAAACSSDRLAPSVSAAGMRNSTQPATGGSFPVEESRTVISDAARSRELPIKIYEPANLATPAPLVIFSHGLGSSREGYRYLGRHWASHGYVVVHVQHPGSDNQLGYLALYRSARGGDVDGRRSRDISAVLDALQMDKPGGLAPDPVLTSLRRQIDFGRIAVAGHSYGAYTALTTAGLLIDFPNQLDRSFRDQRVRAAIAISSPRIFGAPRREDYREIAIPILHMAGTNDRTVIFNTFAHHRRIPFDSIRAPNQYLVTVRGAVHSAFAEEPDDGERPDRAAVHRLTSNATLQFLDAFLRDDARARAWLDTASLDPYATFERRRP